MFHFLHVVIYFRFKQIFTYLYKDFQLRRVYHLKMTAYGWGI
jgi:hypothetical protein